MVKEIIENYRIISTRQLVRAMKEGNENGERFCFIIGAGASASSGILTGGQLEYKWMKEMAKNPPEGPGLSEIQETANKLRDEECLDHPFEEIKQAWETEKKTEENELEKTLSSEYYFDIYKLRFFPNHRNGYHYLENIMLKVKPSFGYSTLANILAKEDNKNNLVITTNFDSLIEDALFLYTGKKALVINHEFLADFAQDPSIHKPIIAKVHRGLFFDPLNKPEEINQLKQEWQPVLEYFFKIYTPIVIGYAGGDKSLMSVLESVDMKNGIYWCYMEKYGLPSKKIQRMIQEKKGHLVTILGFDQMMLSIGLELLYGTETFDKIGSDFRERMNSQIKNYETQYEELTKGVRNNVANPKSQNEIDFEVDVDKLEDITKNSEEERKKTGKLTEWDYLRKGNRKYNLKKYKEAIENYEEAIKLNPKFAEAYNNQACSYAELKRYEEAMSDCNKAIELDSNYAKAYYSRAVIYKRLEKYEEAISDCNKAIELDPNYSIAYSNRGFIYCKLKRYEEAMSDINKVIELNPNDASAYSNRAEIYNKLEEYEKTILDSNKAIELDPNYASAYNNRGVAYNGLREYKKAISDYNKAIELDSNFTDAYNNRAIAYNGLGEYDKAILDCNKAIELDSTLVEAYNNRAAAYIRLREYDKVISDCNKAIELDSNSAAAYNNRGHAYIYLKEYVKASADFEKAIELNSDIAAPYKHYGTLYAQKEDFKKAIEFFTKAIERKPNYKDAYIERAEAYRMLEEKEKAEQDEKTAETL